MSKCLLCKSNFKRQINYEIIFSFVKSKEKYACSDCLQKFVKKKGIVCSGCNKEINKKDCALIVLNGSKNTQAIY